MPIPPKKLKALVDVSKKGPQPPFGMKKKGPPGNKGNPGHGGGHDGHDGHDDHDEHDHEDGHADMGAMVAEAAKKVEEGGEDDVMEHATGYDPELDGNPPQWVADEGKWEKAKQAVNPEGDGEKYSEPWAVVAHVYKKMGGKFKGGSNPGEHGGHDEGHDDHHEPDSEDGE